MVEGKRSTRGLRQEERLQADEHARPAPQQEHAVSVEKVRRRASFQLHMLGWEGCAGWIAWLTASRMLGEAHELWRKEVGYFG